jgi:nondiscriminating glutamyl-tRNA synthetase
MPTPVRARFAPSPTGRLHVGGARTALFNWLFARHHGGTLVLRIEDTDAERSTPAAERALLEDLRWLGIDWDEGPDVGGPHAPYRQTERLPIYAAQAERLLTAGTAFRCFCTDAELESKRQAQLAAGQEPHYDGTCRKLTADALAARRGTPHAIRFHVQPGRVEFADRVRGDMSFDASAVGDFVILRSTGMPTYNFACVVDDAAMQITHVIRGEDHLSNTLRQVLLYTALDLPRPEFAHVSLIVDEHRAKLKKREGRAGTYVDEYRTDGYLPDALANFLALLGWSSPSGDEVLPRERLQREFDLDRVGRAPAVFDAQKLRWMSGEHVRLAPLGTLALGAQPFLQAAGLPADAPHAERYLAAFRDGIACLAELPPLVRELLDPGAPEPEAGAALATPGARRLLSCLDERWETRPGLDGSGFKTLLQECGKELELRGRDLFMPARAALSGRTHGPEIPLLFDALGSETARARVRAAVLGG